MKSIFKIYFTLISICLFALSCTSSKVQNRQIKHPKEDETLVYPTPSLPIGLKPSDKHPTQAGWHFFTAHEFKD